MAPETPLSLPVIDFNNPGALNPGSPEWDSLKAQVGEALREYGCFKALYNGLQPELRKAHFDAMEELFDLPTDVKRLNIYKKPFYGYLEHKPKFEGTGIGSPHILEDVENFANTLWPQGNPNFSKTISSVSKQVAELDGIIRTMMLESLGIENYSEEHMNSTTYLLRLYKYLPPQSNDDEAQIGLKAHTDKAVATILFENDVDGLEVENKQGEWVGVEIPQGSFLFMAGDTLHAWSNGRIRNVNHRVRMRPGKKTRYTGGLFSIPKDDYTVKVPEELVDQAHPLRFKPFNYSEYAKFLASQLDIKAAGNPKVTSIQEYCGI